jgi:hypothetical protein
MNVFNQECVIVCVMPRGHCGNYGTVYHRSLPLERRIKRFTQEFEAFAVTLMGDMLVKRAGQILGERDSRMRRILFSHVKAAYERL